LLETCVFSEGSIVALCVLVEGDDEVIDVLGFGGDLAEDDACSGEAGSVAWVSYYIIYC